MKSCLNRRIASNVPTDNLKLKLSIKMVFMIKIKFLLLDYMSSFSFYIVQLLVMLSLGQCTFVCVNFAVAILYVCVFFKEHTKMTKEIMVQGQNFHANMPRGGTR